jgi:small subunit ribosomal protein S21
MSKHYKLQDPIVKGTHVEVRNNDVSRAMRKLKKILNNDGVFQELRDREAFEKPSITKKKQRAAARKRWLRKLDKDKLI